MKNLFKSSRPRPEPILAPLGARPGIFRRLRQSADGLPAAAVPVAVTLAGGVALVVALAAVFGGQPRDDASREPPAPREAVREAAAPDEAPPAAGNGIAAMPAPVEEEVPAAVTAAPDPDPDMGMPIMQDPGRTASILPALPDVGAFMPPVAVAETDEEIAALETIQRREVEADVGAPEPEQETTASIGAQAAPAMRAAVATSHVNMRAGPDDGAEVLLVVPAQAAIEAEEACNWCAVSYDGRSGFVYRTFIDYR